MAKKAATTTEIVPQTEVESYKKVVASAEKFSTSLEVKSDGDYHKALTEGKRIKEQLEIIIARKEEITKPLNAAVKSVRDLFKPLETAGENALKAIKSKMLDYTNEKDRKAEEDKKKIAERVERGTMKPETAVRKMGEVKASDTTVTTDAGSATTRTVKKWRVIDKTKIPLDFMEPDMVKIKASFRSGTPVSGVEEYEEKELALS